MKDFKSVTKTVVSLSGGLDSSILLALAVRELGVENVYALSMSYGQRHSIELECAKRTCQKLGVYHKIIDISFLGEITKNVSAMVSDIVPTPTMGDLEAGKKVPTYVPFRNLILSGIVLSFAEAMGADSVALGVQYGDYALNDYYRYWDTHPSFTQKLQEIADLNDKHKLSYVTPFIDLTKKDEIELALELKADLSTCWTCYNPVKVGSQDTFVDEPAGGKNLVIQTLYKPCGKCPSCEGRIAAFKAAGIEDPVEKYGVWV